MLDTRLHNFKVGDRVRVNDKYGVSDNFSAEMTAPVIGAEGVIVAVDAREYYGIEVRLDKFGDFLVHSNEIDKLEVSA